MKKNFKKWRSNFFINERGAVSLYLIIITLLLFLFNAVLIDYARILIAERQTEEAAKIALRSTMSSYHQKLQDKGLFAFEGDQEKADNIFKDVFKKNLLDGEGDGFNYLGLESVDEEITTDLNLDRSLSNENILKYQILEEMKYKAPVEIAEALIKNFLKLSSQMEELSDYSSIADDLNDDAISREVFIENAKKEIERAKEKWNLIDGVMNTSGNSTYPDVENLSDIIKHKGDYTEYKDKKKDLEEEDDDYPSEEDDDDAENYLNSSRELINELLSDITVTVGHLQNARNLIKDAQDRNDNIKHTIENRPTSNNYDDAKEIGDHFGEGNDEGVGTDSGSLLEEYVMDDAFFEKMKEDLDFVIHKITTHSDDNYSIMRKINVYFLDKIVNDQVHLLSYDELSDTRDDYSQVKTLITLIEEKINEHEDYEETAEEIEEKEKEADESLGDNKDEFDEINELIDAAEIAYSDTQKLRAVGDSARDYGDAIQANNHEFPMEDREDTKNQAMSFMDILFSNIGAALLSGRDELYINEYILMRFQSHNFDIEGETANIYENNQVEYIIYGLETYGLNYLAALGEIFAVRLAINLIAGLKEPKSKLFGPLSWIISLSLALGWTVSDMNKITSGESVNIFPGVRRLKDFKMDYKDHLRLFLFAHPEGGKYSRMMAVLHEQTGKDLTKSSTYISANATASIRLWFLPQVANLLTKANIIEGRVEGNYYYIDKEVHFSY